VRSAFGSPEPFGPIELVADESRVIGCAATWSPNGVYYDGFGIAIKAPDSPPDDRRPIVSNDQLGIPTSEDARTDMCAGLGISWIGVRGAASGVRPVVIDEPGLYIRRGAVLRPNRAVGARRERTSSP